MAVRLGYKRVLRYPEGYKGWLGTGLPVEFRSVKGFLGVGEPFPDIELAAPRLLWERENLGLGGEDFFKVTDLGFERILVVLFSYYCNSCRKDAPKINALNDLIKREPRLSERIRVVAIGMGNNTEEIEAFRRDYHVNFTLIPDPDFRVHKAFGEIRTPSFIYAEIKPGRRAVVLKMRMGPLGDPQRFLKAMESLQ